MARWSGQWWTVDALGASRRIMFAIGIIAAACVEVLQREARAARGPGSQSSHWAAWRHPAVWPVVAASAESRDLAMTVLIDQATETGVRWVNKVSRVFIMLLYYPGAGALGPPFLELGREPCKTWRTRPNQNSHHLMMCSASTTACFPCLVFTVLSIILFSWYF